MKFSYFLIFSAIFLFSIPAWAVEGQNTTTVGVTNQTTTVVSPTSIGSDGKRSLPNPGNIQFPGLISDFTGPVDRGPNYTDIRWFLFAKGMNHDGSVTFTRSEIERAFKKIEGSYDKPKIKTVSFLGNLSKKEKVNSIRLYFRNFIANKRGEILPPKRPRGFIFIAQANTRATSKNEVTAENLVVALMTAMDSGANVLISNGQGAIKYISSSSFGIGIASTGYTMKEGGQSATAAAGVIGIGYAKGLSHCEMRPWNQFIFGRIPE